MKLSLADRYKGWWKGGDEKIATNTEESSGKEEKPKAGTVVKPEKKQETAGKKASYMYFVIVDMFLEILKY